MALSAPRAQRPFTADRLPAAVSPLLLALAALVLGVAGGLAVVKLGPLLPLLLVIGVAGAALVLLDARWGLLACWGVIALLPFGTLPFKVAITPTLLECALALTWLVVGLRLILFRDELLRPSPLDGLTVLFLLITLFAFVLGFGRGYTTSTLHDYGKMVLSISLFFLVTNLVRTRLELRLSLTAVTVLAGGAAVLGLGLWALGRRAEVLLARLAIVGYPTGKIIRYIEDDPAKAIRATGTGVDPNSFAGLLMIALIVVVAQAAAQRPLVPRLLTFPAAPALALCLLLTQSRAAWLGAAAGIGIVAVLRYRWMLPPMAAGAAAVLALGIGGGFVQRLVLGFRLQDPATKLRLSEYRNALAIIQEHPWFGIGFGSAPSIDLQAGVSSVYLAIAERMGLVGLALFLVILAFLALQLWPVVTRRALRDTPEAEATLALAAALLGAAVTGVLDHYFFNIVFSHMVALFWGLAALALVAARLAGEWELERTSGRNGERASGRAGERASGYPRVHVPAPTP
ncbi:MAG: O-antigen ligase family protein [Chloroflexia bacterium]